MDRSVNATFEINNEREEGIWSTYTAPVNTNIKGVHDVYFAFRGEKDLFYFDRWKFKYTS